MGKPAGDLGEDGEVPVVVEKQVELDGPLCLMVRGPVKKGQAQLDEGGIEAEELVPEVELFLTRGYLLNFTEELVKYCLIELPGSSAVRIGEGASLIPRCFSLPRQLARPPDISRRERAWPRWQKSMATNWSQQENPFAPFCAPVSFTAE
jgi:hypothetical protein